MKLKLTQIKFFSKYSFRCILVILILHLSTLLYYDYNSFYLGDYDYVSINEIISETSRGNFFQTYYHGESGNFLAHHFSISLLFFIPFIFITKTKIGYGIGLIFYSILSLVITKKILDEYFGKFFSAILFLILSLNIYSYRLFISYHFEIFFLFSFLLYFLGIKKKYISLELIGLFITILLKEDIPYYILFFSFFFLINNEFKRFTITSSIILFYSIVIIPNIQKTLNQNSSVNFLLGWSEYGKNIPEILISFIRKFDLVFMQFLSKKKILLDLILGLGLPSLFTSIFFLIIPILVLHFTSNRIWYNSLYNYYCYTILPFLIIGFILGTKKIFENKKLKTWRIYISVFLFSTIFLTSSKDTDFPRKFRQIPATRLQRTKEAIELIPENSIVSVSFDLGALLKSNISLRPLSLSSNTQFILFDSESTSPYVSNEDMKLFLEQLINKKEYNILFSNKTLVLLKKND
ncbi:MAG: DUF2079 domain-containing protein [Leptospiraceae bacterium]|nr:DUF2079 domain-containing protein [Leptospiraceae bacterium]